MGLFGLFNCQMFRIGLDFTYCFKFFGISLFMRLFLTIRKILVYNEMNYEYSYKSALL